MLPVRFLIQQQWLAVIMPFNTFHTRRRFVTSFRIIKLTSRLKKSLYCLVYCFANLFFRKKRPILDQFSLLKALGKSCKPIPVMILGVLFAQKRYPLSKYLFVFMIVIGVTVFLYKEKKGAHLAGSIQFGFGEILLVKNKFERKFFKFIWWKVFPKFLSLKCFSCFHYWWTVWQGRFKTVNAPAIRYNLIIWCCTWICGRCFIIQAVSD